jgi:CubicO group peptidase (beta-lactamase class C family)
MQIIKSFRTFVIVPVMLLFLLQATPISAQKKITIAGVSTQRLERFEQFIQSEITSGKIPGAVTLILRNNEVVHQGAYGYKNAAEKIPANQQDLFFIQSMTKPVITVAFMMLYEEGHFMLTDPISKYLPEFKNVRVLKNQNDGLNGATDSLTAQPTIAQILSHSSGLVHGLGQSNFEKEFRRAYFDPKFTDIQSRASAISKYPLVCQPGKAWNYSMGPDILSMLIEKFSGMSTRDFLMSRIFKPLGMNDTDYNVSASNQNRIFKLHTKGDGAPIMLSANQPKSSGVTLWSGVNGLFTTAKDYSVFCQMLLNNGTWNGTQFLSRKTIDLMTSNHVGNLFNRPGEGFGLGFAVVTDAAATQLPGSNGLYYWAGAYNTHFFIDPKEKLIAIFLTQESNFMHYYHEKLRQLVYQAVAD